MLNGLYKIDGVDMWETYGAAILKGSYNSLLSYPTRKAPDSDDWFEEDYADIDYSSLYFDSSDVTLRVGIYGSSRSDLLNKLQLFENSLNQAGHRQILISGIDTPIILRYKGASGAESSPLLVGNQFYLEQDLLFSNDNPAQLFTINSVFDKTFDHTFTGYSGSIEPLPIDIIVWNNFSINGIPVSNYGMGVTSFNGFALQFNPLKEPLVNTFQNRDGADSFVSKPLKYQQKSLPIGMVMAHNNTTDLINNYNSLFYTLSVKSPISIYSDATGLTYYGYYSKQDNLNISISSNLKILEFEIELIITRIDG